MNHYSIPAAGLFLSLSMSCMADQCLVEEGIYDLDMKALINRNLAVQPQGLNAVIYVQAGEEDETGIAMEVTFIPDFGSTEIYRISSDKTSCTENNVNIEFSNQSPEPGTGMLASLKSFFEGIKTLDGTLRLVFDAEKATLNSFDDIEKSCYLRRDDQLYRSYFIVNDPKTSVRQCTFRRVEKDDRDSVSAPNPNPEL